MISESARRGAMTPFRRGSKSGAGLGQAETGRFELRVQLEGCPEQKASFLGASLTKQRQAEVVAVLLNRCLLVSLRGQQRAAQIVTCLEAIDETEQRLESLDAPGKILLAKTREPFAEKTASRAKLVDLVLGIGPGGFRRRNTPHIAERAQLLEKLERHVAELRRGSRR